MTNEIILQKILASYCFIPFEQIKLNQEIIDNYVTAAFKDNLAGDICHEWRTVNCTKLHNDLFVTVKTGNDILKLI